MATVLFFAMMTFFIYWLISAVFIPPGEIKTPDLRGKSIGDAAKELHSYNLSIKWERDQPSETVENGNIIAQWPEPNKLIKKGSQIRVVVSGGIPLVQLPDLRRVPQNRARAQLVKLGLKDGNRTFLPSPGDPVGTVLETDPPAGTGVPQGSKINLLVATGQTRMSQAMPNLQGMKLEQAREALTKAGLFATEVPVSTANATPGQVVGQAPAAGDQVSENTNVVIRYTPSSEDAGNGEAAAASGEATGDVKPNDLNEKPRPAVDDTGVPPVNIPAASDPKSDAKPAVPEAPPVKAEDNKPAETKPGDLEGKPAPPPANPGNGERIDPPAEIPAGQ